MEFAMTLGFTAGWMFLCAAPAATAALGFAGHLLHLSHLAPRSPPERTL